MRFVLFMFLVFILLCGGLAFAVLLLAMEAEFRIEKRKGGENNED